MMGRGEEEGKFNPPPPLPEYDLNAKMEACIDITLRKTLYSSLSGAFAGLLLFRSPVTRWTSVAFGAGVGIGSAYIESSYTFGGSPPKQSTQKVSVFPFTHEEHEPMPISEDGK